MLTQIILVYLIIINAAAFLLMLIDKQKAKRSAWRIPEATLMGVAALGGSIGAIAGMYVFRHKTRHVKFFLGLPAILIIQIALVIWIRSMI
jgi:uncharacterized membrane protein YsdA (DUF1294 family)